MIYLDTSALAKLVLGEPEADALGAWLEVRSNSLLATSVITEVELARASRRSGVTDVARIEALLDEVLLIDLSPEVRRAAARLPDPLLRSLDAIHLASAYELRPDLTTIITYDVRMANAVDSTVEVASPGTPN